MNEHKKPWHVRFGISKKLLLSVVILTVLICAISTISGYYHYDNTIRKLYNDHGYEIGNIILDNIDHDKVAEYVRTWTEDADYAEISDYIKSVAESAEVAFIYMVTVNEDQTIRYVFDSTGMAFGATDPVSAYFDEVWAAYTQGTRPDSYLVRHSPKYGFLTSSVLPVIDSQGNVVALLLVDVWMKVVITTLRSYILNMILISLGVLAVFSVIYWGIMRKSFVNPLMRIRDNVTEFARNETVTTTTLEDIQTKDEIQQLAESISQMEGDIVGYIGKIKTITAEKERIGAELNVATQIQADMLPRIFPPFPDRTEFDIYATMDPAKEVGGDFYDFFLVDDDHLALVMADVSGKGIPAAMFMMTSRTMLKDAVQTGLDPARAMRRVNDLLCENNRDAMFVTVWLGILTVSTGELIYADAGHEKLLLYHDGAWRFLPKDSAMALAVIETVEMDALPEQYRFQNRTIRLAPGDAVFQYTDGVTEATYDMNAEENAGETMFGEERLLLALGELDDPKPDELLPHIRARVDEFVKGGPQFDDITMLALRYCGRKSE